MRNGGAGEARRIADPRRVAVEALVRIDAEGAYANLVVPHLLARSGMTSRDRAFTTELVYGATRMRRACDWAVDSFLDDPGRVDPRTRAVLRMGAYQLKFLATPAHAAVSSAVDQVPPRKRGLVNAVLRKVAAADGWPDEDTRLSYPGWLADRLRSDLGPDRAMAAMEAMNEPAQVSRRPDGYTQDRASQWAAELVGAAAGERVADLCAAPGGKSTMMASAGAMVAAADVRLHRARLVAANAHRLDRAEVATLVADGTRPPFSDETFDRVLVDAPCTGLGVLRRRPDARWRVRPADVTALAQLQRRLLDAASALVRRGGRVVYAVCTMTGEETSGVDSWLAGRHPELEALDPPPPPWEAHGRGALLLPQKAGTDGMFVLSVRRR